jgi:hypothetical protein
MIEEKTLQFQVVSDEGTNPLNFPVNRIICAGYSGRSQDAVQEHVRELVALGMPAPDSTPIFFQVSNYLATTSTGVTVQERLTSGEVEFVLLFHNGQTYVTCGSDHTHRGLERYSIPGSKQMHPKILAKELWQFSDVEKNWDELTLRSWATVSGRRELYQEAPLSHILPPAQLIRDAEQRFKVREEGTIFMSGTLPTVGGHLVYADHFAFELQDSSRKRTIRHGYEVHILD